MDCVGQPGVDLEFHADFKSGFSFSVRLIPISAESGLHENSDVVWIGLRSLFNKHIAYDIGSIY